MKYAAENVMLPYARCRTVNSNLEEYSGCSVNRSKHAIRPVTYEKGSLMNSIIYIVGVVVIIVVILGFFGLR